MSARSETPKRAPRRAPALRSLVAGTSLGALLADLLILLMGLVAFAIKLAHAAGPWEIVTAQNRRYVGATGQMSGGWGPHLRDFLAMDDGSRFFVIDSGPSVEKNTALHYLKRGASGGWRETAVLGLAPGIQQNMAHVTDGKAIYSYGVDVVSSTVRECALDTTGESPSGCRTLASGGVPLRTLPSSNYVGAAIARGGTRIVWWTSVGGDGGAGSFTYTWTAGRDWARPVTSPLVTRNDVGYVSADVAAAGDVLAAGQGWEGKYPAGRPVALVARFRLGERVVWSESLVGASSVQDLWRDEGSGIAHVVATLAHGGAGYFAFPATQHATVHAPLETFGSAYRLRFTKRGDDTALYLVRDDRARRKLVIHRKPSPTLGTAAWKGAVVAEIDYPYAGTGSDGLSALWVERPSKQLLPASAQWLGVCGEYPRKDDFIWAVPFPSGSGPPARR